MNIRLLAVSLCIISNSSLAADDALRVLPLGTGDAAPSAMMSRYLKQLAYAAFDRRTAEYEKIKTPEDVVAYQKRIREFFVQSLGGFPERTPLYARVVGKLEREDFTVEKIIFESRHRFFVTGALYLPRGPKPCPVVLVPCGHSANGKAAEAYQRACILLAKNGIAAFCYDPIGQGERYQVLDESGKPKHGSTLEHTLVSMVSAPLGLSAASYRVWDGMRAIDYLVSRPDLDAKRIGCAGNSGGGTLTSYLMALDDRIVAAAPNCYLTTLRRLIDTIGPQDGEQNIFGQIAFGMDHADYVIARAPRPTQMGVATRDFFDITGAWDTFRQAKRIYARLGFPERMDLVETDNTHGWNQQLREGCTRFMRRWLLGKDDVVVEPAFPVFTDAELQCTPRGQVLLIEGARSVFDLNNELSAKLANWRKEFSREQALANVRELAGIRPLSEIPALRAEKVGEVKREGYVIEKLALSGEPGLTLPALAFVPPTQRNLAVLYLRGEGKHLDAAPGGPIEKMVKEGHLVLAVDLRGLGETAITGGNAQSTSILDSDTKDHFLAYLLGKSHVGMRAEDTLACARFLSTFRAGDTPNRVRVIATGEAAIPALHAAAVEAKLFAAVDATPPIASWSSIVGKSDARRLLTSGVQYALKWYDLPDLRR